MFGFSYREGGPWDDNGIKAIIKFLDRIERLSDSVNSLPKSKKDVITKNEKDLLYATNYAIKNIDKDMEDFSFNTAVARLMELVNALYKYDAIPTEEKNVNLYKDCYEKLLLLLAPCAPHFAEEIWESLGKKNSIFHADYPVCDEKALVKDEVEIVIQINSKGRSKAMIPSGASNDQIKEIVLSDEKIASEIKDKEIKKFIVVPNRLVNIIV